MECDWESCYRVVMLQLSTRKSLWFSWWRRCYTNCSRWLCSNGLIRTLMASRMWVFNRFSIVEFLLQPDRKIAGTERSSVDARIVDIVRQLIPDLGGCNWRGSVTDGWQFERSYSKIVFWNKLQNTCNTLICLLLGSVTNCHWLRTVRMSADYGVVAFWRFSRLLRVVSEKCNWFLFAVDVVIQAETVVFSVHHELHSRTVVLLSAAPLVLWTWRLVVVGVCDACLP